MSTNRISKMLGIFAVILLIVLTFLGIDAIPLPIAENFPTKKILDLSTFVINPQNFWVGGTAYTQRNFVTLNIPSENESLLGFGGIFNSNATGEIRMYYNFSLVQDFSDWEYLDISLFAENATAKKVSTFQELSHPSYSWGLYLYDLNGQWKGYDGYGLDWLGLKDFVVPLRFRPSYIDVSKGWNDAWSLKHIVSLGVDLNKEVTTQDLQPHYLYLRRIALTKNDFTLYNSAVFAGVLLLFGSAVYLIVKKIPFFDFLSERSLISNKQVIKHSSLVVMIAILVKATLMTVTPLSSDFIDIVFGATGAVNGYNFLSGAPTEGGLFAIFQHGIYHIWALIPVDHPKVLMMFPGNFFQPTLGRSIWYFPHTPGTYLFVFMMKFPNLMFDFLIGVLLYYIVLMVGKNKSVAIIASLFWFLNPYVTLIAEMWASVDIVAIFFLILGIYLFMRGRFLKCAASIALGGSIKIFPILFFPFFLLFFFDKSRIPKENRFRHLVIFGTTALVVFMLLILPFFWYVIFIAPYASRTVWLPSLPDNTFILGPEISSPTGWSWYAGGFIIVITVLFAALYFLIVKDYFKIHTRSYIGIMLGFAVVLFAFTRFQPHWLLLVMPFLALDYALNPTRRSYPLLYLISLFSFVLVWGGSYFSSMGNSVFFVPNLNTTMEGVSAAFYNLSTNGVLVDTLRYLDITRSLLTAVSLGYVLRIILQNQRNMLIFKRSNKNV